MRKAEVYYENRAAGVLAEDDEGYRFKYHEEYLNLPEARAVSLTLPLQEEEYFSMKLFPFFDGLIPEGWLLSIAERNWKLDSRDRMGLLLACCKDCIGAVSVRPGNEQ
ncbi:MAG TPA: phosphatidylinositol kinase [Spirochaeta sp.]|nr:phosphatidylinositol kinase [Spirochaeta sp.]